MKSLLITDTGRKDGNTPKGLNDIWRLRRHSAVPHISKTYRLLEEFAYKERTDFLYASYESIMQHGLNVLFDQKLAAVFYESKKSVICCFTPDLVDSEYTALVNYIPRNGVSPSHMVDEVPSEDMKNIFEAIRISIRAIIRVAEKKKEALRKIYVVQHIGPEESNQEFSSKTTNFQMHFHVYGISGRHLSKSTQDKRLIRMESNFTFWDPTTFIVHDMLKAKFPTVYVDSFTSSIVLKNKKLQNDATAISFGAEDSDIGLISSVCAEWRSLWNEVTACFTDFSTDENGRYLPLARAMREKNVAMFVQRHPELSNESRIALMWAASHLRNAVAPNDKKAEHNFSKGAYGSIGYTLDLVNLNVNLRFAPRTLISEQYGSTDGEFLRHRDRSRMLPLKEREKILRVQNEIVNEILLDVQRTQ